MFFAKLMLNRLFQGCDSRLFPLRAACNVFPSRDALAGVASCEERENSLADARRHSLQKLVSLLSDTTARCPR